MYPSLHLRLNQLDDLVVGLFPPIRYEDRRGRQAEKEHEPITRLAAAASEASQV